MLKPTYPIPIEVCRNLEGLDSLPQWAALLQWVQTEEALQLRRLKALKVSDHHTFALDAARISGALAITGRFTSLMQMVNGILKQETEQTSMQSTS